MITSPRRALMSFLDRWLAAWILLAMVAGLLIGRLVHAVEPFLSAMELGDISVPIALGLMVMMYPPLAQVRYDKAVEITSDRRRMGAAVVLSRDVGPAFMFHLSCTLLPDEPGSGTSVVVVGLA